MLQQSKEIHVLQFLKKENTHSCYIKMFNHLDFSRLMFNKTKDWALVQTAALAINQGFNVRLG